jgi:hypothetical protein
MWDDIAVDMVPSGRWTKQLISETAKTWNAPQKSECEGNAKLHLAKILPAEYKPVDINAVIIKQTHLTSNEQDLLKTVLLEFQDLFQGKKVTYNGEAIELELLPEAKPFYEKPFSIPKAYQQITKDEINHLESIGILTKIPSSEWRHQCLSSSVGSTSASKGVHIPCQ